jgi:carbonic anhydrase/SulP family sulfate permease
MGDIFSIRIAGNISSRKVIASAEYGCAVAGAKLILVMGHTRCGAVTAAVNLLGSAQTAAEATGCEHFDYVINDLRQSADEAASRAVHGQSSDVTGTLVDGVARRNVVRVAEQLHKQSRTIDGLIRKGQIAIVGAMYDVVTGDIEFLRDDVRAT